MEDKGFLKEKKNIKPASEKKLEKQFRKAVENLGCRYIKFMPTEAGIPDRICLLPNGIAVFVEFKSEGKEPTRLQRWQHLEFKRKGFNVLVVSSHEDSSSAVLFIDQKIRNYAVYAKNIPG